MIVYPKGVWDPEETLSFEKEAQFSAGDRVVLQPQEPNEVELIPVTTIDRLVAELRLERVDFIKMHVEGAEHQAIAGAQVAISKFRPRLAISAHHQPDDAKRIPELVRLAWPHYRMKCGDCSVALRRLIILPDMLFFFQ